MIYWHVERKSLCVHSQLTTCSASEVAAMIEGLLRQETGAGIDRNYTDTHGASIVGFAIVARHGHQRRRGRRLPRKCGGGPTGCAPLRSAPLSGGQRRCHDQQAAVKASFSASFEYP